MISSSNSLFFSIGFCLYFAVDSTCPTSGGIHTIAVRPRSCTGLIGPFTSNDTNIWSDGTTSVISSTFTGTYIGGQLAYTIIGNVISGNRFNGATATAVYTYANISLDCLNNGGISGLSGLVELHIVDIIGLFICIGTASLSFNPPITNTLQNVTVTVDVNYSSCLGLC